MIPLFSARAARCWMLALGCHVPAVQATVELPLNVPYAVVRKALAERIFTQAGERIQVLADSSRCNSLILSEPRIESGGDGYMRVLVRMVAHGGTPLGDHCILPFDWVGTIELRETAYIAAEPYTVAFRIADSNLLDEGGQHPTVPGVLWNWIKLSVHPRMEAFTFDLSPLFDGTRELISSALQATPESLALSRDSLRLASAVPAATALTTVIAFEPPYLPALPLDPVPAAPLSAEELAAWDAAWQSWDAFATWTIKLLGSAANDDLRAALLETLVEARYELRDALARPPGAADPVRALFRTTWARLAPLLPQAAQAVSGADAWRYLVFISAGDALSALDAAAGPVGLRLDQATLQSLARALLPNVTLADLTYSTAVDPALRALFGFPPSLVAEERGGDALSLAWLIRDAAATNVDPAALTKLNRWVPKDDDLDRYIATMETLLADIAADEQKRGKVPVPFVTVYGGLLRATAWQETCWRQYVEKRGVVVPLRSSAGSVGVMQINKHVWRGVYAVDELERDVAYNARAGNEILVHYLVDYAIRKKEHEASGGIHNLARATYAVYNGGPAHLHRYRDPKEKASLRAIDQAFWTKYQKMRDRGPEAVKSCYGS